MTVDGLSEPFLIVALVAGAVVAELVVALAVSRYLRRIGRHYPEPRWRR